MSQTSLHLEGFDIIGDIHGCESLLRKLLIKLGYEEGCLGYSHPTRKVVFLGDLIDRGSDIRGVVLIAKAMVEAGNAYAVLGNHEYNALVFAQPDENVSDKRKNKLRELLRASLSQYEHYTSCWEDTLEWFKTLPLYLEFDGFRVVHACWDQDKIQQLAVLSSSQRLDDEYFLRESIIPGTPENRVVERLLRGTDMRLPEGITLKGSDGVVRSRFRTKFWVYSPHKYQDIVFQPDRLPASVENQPLTQEEKNQLVCYRKEEKPLFVGHYWRQGTPQLICSNIACLDYSAVKQGKLVAYRFDKGDLGLSSSKLCWVK